MSSGRRCVIFFYKRSYIILLGRFYFADSRINFLPRLWDTFFTYGWKICEPLETSFIFANARLVQLRVRLVRNLETRCKCRLDFWRFVPFPSSYWCHCLSGARAFFSEKKATSSRLAHKGIALNLTIVQWASAKSKHLHLDVRLLGFRYKSSKVV